jgi:hypothetical protein
LFASFLWGGIKLCFWALLILFVFAGNAWAGVIDILKTENMAIAPPQYTAGDTLRITGDYPLEASD